MRARRIFEIFLIVLFAVFVPVSFLNAAAKNKDIVVENDFTYSDEGKRDPFWPLLGHRGTIVNYDKDILATDLILEGIMAEPTGGSIAIINGNIVKLGDKVGLFIVKEIQGNTVVLEKGQNIVTLKLKKEE